MINSNPACYKPLKDWYKNELKRLGITEADILEKYKAETGKSGAMLRHYFRDSQFELPTEEVFTRVYYPLGFRWRGKSAASEYEGLRQEYEGLRQEYEGLRQEYEEKFRHPHTLDKNHSNVWYSQERTGAESTGQRHSCEKPVDILERIIRTSTRDGQTVLDMFGGSGSTAVAAYNTGRRYIVNEGDRKTFEKMRRRIAENEAQISIEQYLQAKAEEGKAENVQT
jgi:site-specific DNA-methyltransferase (adenine-specific)